MEKFRRLAKNIFFKIVLAIVGLSFVLFGISGFITGMPNSWVLKIGNEKFSANSFEKALDVDRKIIRSVKGSTPEIEEYLSSEKFKSDLANRLVRKILIQKISNEIGAFGSKKLILKTVAEDNNFQDKDGKFDHEKFSNFLKNNGLDEERYIHEVSNEVSAEMIIQTLSMASPVNFKSAIEIEEFNQEKRIVDVIKVNKDNVRGITAPTDEEITKFHDENKALYKTKELRKASYVEIDPKAFESSLANTPEEIQKYYDDNKTLFSLEENKDFYHMIFEKKEQAQEFHQKIVSALDATKSNTKEQFAKIAKDFHKKNLKDITLEKITKNALPPEISKAISDLKLNQLSDLVESKLGFHVFLLNNINDPKQIPFAEVENKINEKLIAEKKDKLLQDSITKINDSLMTSKSLAEVATKFNLKIVEVSSPFNAEGRNENNIEIVETKTLNDFVKNAFVLKQNQPSKIISNEKNGKYYALEIEKIIESRDPELTEIKSKIIADIIDKKKQSELTKLAQQIQNEITENPSQALSIAGKYGLLVEKSKTFPRVFYIDLGTSQMPYKNQFLEDIFVAKIGEATKAISVSPGEYLIGIVRKNQKAKFSAEEVVQVKKKAVEMLATDIMFEYNQYLQKKYPIEINEKFFGKKS
jgi:peptidyl-prolyl cis-trans isomerase D